MERARWRFFEGPYGEWHWISMSCGVERGSRQAYAVLEDSLRDAYRHGMREDDHKELARLVAVPHTAPAVAGARHMSRNREKTTMSECMACRALSHHPATEEAHGCLSLEERYDHPEGRLERYTCDDCGTRWERVVPVVPVERVHEWIRL